MTDTTNTDLAETEKPRGQSGASNGSIANQYRPGRDGEATQGEITPHPVLSIPDQEPQPQEVDVEFAAPLAAALQDILPTHWDVGHPGANLFQVAHNTLDEYWASLL